jgi:hypothetical protein
MVAISSIHETARPPRKNLAPGEPLYRHYISSVHIEKLTCIKKIFRYSR